MKLFCSALTVAALAGLGAALERPALHSGAPLAADTYKVDPVHSTVVFHTKHVGISQTYGRFDRISAEKSAVTFDPADPGKSSLLLVIDADSVDTNAPDRDKHVKSPDFFSVKEFPEIVFESKKISGKSDDLEVTGDLTFHGVSKSVKAKARLVGQGEVAMSRDYRAGFVAEFQIDMRDFGLDFVKKNPGAVGPEVALTVSLECVKE